MFISPTADVPCVPVTIFASHSGFKVIIVGRHIESRILVIVKSLFEGIEGKVVSVNPHTLYLQQPVGYFACEYRTDEPSSS